MVQLASLCALQLRMLLVPSMCICCLSDVRYCSCETVVRAAAVTLLTTLFSATLFHPQLGLKVARIADFARQLVSGIKYVHGLDIVHNNICLRCSLRLLDALYVF